jgi:hypothetical protein
MATVNDDFKGSEVTLDGKWEAYTKDQYAEIALKAPSSNWAPPTTCSVCGAAFVAGETVQGESSGGPWTWWHSGCVKPNVRAKPDTTAEKNDEH